MRQKKPSMRAEDDHHQVDASFIRLYILFRADVEPISSGGISEELAHRELIVRARLIAQFFRGLQNKGLLKSVEVGRGNHRHTIYHVTRHKRLVIDQAREKLRCLFEAPN